MAGAKTSELNEISSVRIGNDNYYKLSNSDALRPFFMSIVSDSNHWMFISSNGGLSAGRKDAEHALFPYYTDDKITESAEITGSKSIFLVHKGETAHLWEPFSERFDGMYRVTRNLYKHIHGNKILFEEVNHDLGLTFSYEWNSSNRFGFVRKACLLNNSGQEMRISVLDGIQNIMPHGVNSDLQNQSSNLVDAYKRNELEGEIGLGIYSLSAIIVDRAEPSEALKANVVWSLGLDNPTYLVSSLQLRNFRKGIALQQEEDIRAEKGAYFVNVELVLSPDEDRSWMIVANVNQNHAAIAELSEAIRNEQDLDQIVQEDIDKGAVRLVQLCGAADGLQLSSDHLRDTRHFSNTLFNIMRGGIFDDNYQIEKWDFANYLSNANASVFQNGEHKSLPDVFSLTLLKQVAAKSTDVAFKRLCMEYMPLKFSRRHGDPSRPWNRFSINTRNELDGSKILDYEGNWRDIFQNWEALALSYPAFLESMIHKFLNATTFDGYNPYRVTKGGFDWETIEPDNPWSYIGYWGDHQIIYLLKFLEHIEDYYPGTLASYLDDESFVYANVPYKIKPYEKILEDPKDTIEFDEEADNQIRANRELEGADAALLRNQAGDIHVANFTEKILATVLAKLSNFIPEGGIWMNTQRPEWNDANNALVGNGVSMVTLYYLRRFLTFLTTLLNQPKQKEVAVSVELLAFFEAIEKTFAAHRHLLSGKVSDKDRKKIVDGLGMAGSDYRERIYVNRFSGDKKSLPLKSVVDFSGLALQYIEHSISANKRSDDLYHAYNLMTVENEQEVSISYLSEMLEGQVAVLSSGSLSAKEALAVLDALKSSALFREDQYTYLLYPNKELPRFINKNNIPEEAIAASRLLTQLVKDGNAQLVEKDVNGVHHFNGNFKNADDLRACFETLAQTKYAPLVEQEGEQVLQVFESIFNHKAFTGRSGTFFGYEGLGSIYMHMVSKLLLAVQECCLQAIEANESDVVIGKLLEHYYEINAGIGIHKPPALYGAFPTDPYSHIPGGKGAQQPGMTGQVKEDIISRFGELGVFAHQGVLYFRPGLLRESEFLAEPQLFNYIDVLGEKQQIDLPKGALCFTCCQVPVVYEQASENSLKIVYKDNTSKVVSNSNLDAATSKQLFERTNTITRIVAKIKRSDLR